MKVFAKSDIGKAREMNQDAYYASQPSETVGLYIVADGMGGYNGGEVASTLAVTTAKNYIENNFAQIEHTKEKIEELVKNAIEYANMVVYEKSKEVKMLEGMGTTMEVALVKDNRVYIGHVGDSRIYRIRKNFIRKLTTDHSYVEKLVKDGTITREEALHHPKKNMLTKALGCTSFVEPDTMVKGFLKDDILVITSDGLTNMVKDEEIYNTITENVDTAAEILVEKANEAGGLDNITVIIVQNKT
jgi:PPM family protein phosphatase